MTQRRFLVVDDEVINLQIIREYLDDTGYDLDLVTRAESAWEHLNDESRTYDLVILDRMMPGMSGIDLIRKMKTHARFSGIPVIMQTAAAAPEQVREGIDAGAYYYLTKPYEPETLLAIVRAALNDITVRESARREARQQVQAMELMRHAEFAYQKLEQVEPLVHLLASMCPVPERAASGLSELLVNAVEHGNLGITYAEKKRLRIENNWESEIARRQADPLYRDRIVNVRVVHLADRLEFTVSDEGEGFDWRRYLNFEPERATDPNGRGIALARMMSFSDVHYNGRGNSVTAIVSLG